MKYSRNEIPGWMSLDELDWLYFQAEKCQNIVEVGSWCGRSSHALLSGCPGTVTCIDTWKGSESEINTTHARAKTDDIFAEFMANVGHFPNLRVIRGDSVEASQQFADGSLDMVFLDADHAYEWALRDLKAWKPKTKMLCGHDRSQDGVPRALKEVGILITPGPGSIWIAGGTQEVEKSRDVEIVLKGIEIPLGLNL